VSTGVTVGSGPTVDWDLKEGRLGIQTAKVEVTDQQGAKTSATVRVDLAVCGSCDPPKPPCPSLNVVSPTNVRYGQIAIFRATVSPHDPSAKLSYLWSLINGQLISGQEGTTLRIKAVGQPGDVITATVKIMGLDPACNRKASAGSLIKRADN
jgi:hypothetical protein